jgi:inosine/xanthosine triphosphatase
MKKVIVASKNPVKIEVARKAFAAVFPAEQFDFIGVQSESGVPEQPMGNETIKGAQNRLRFIKKNNPAADFWISQEGGTWREGARLFEQACIMVTDQTNYITESLTAKFYLPKELAHYIEEGMELGMAADKFFNSVNSKHGLGAIGHLTDGIIDRTNYYLQAAIIALSELKHKEWYQ